MAINKTSQYKGYKEEKLQEKQVYLFKILSARAVESQNSGNLYLRTPCEVAEGPSRGYQASFPNFTFMMQHSHDDAQSERYQKQSMDNAFLILGVFPPAIFPTDPDEETDFTLALEGALFEGTCKPSDNPKYWEIAEVYGPAKVEAGAGAENEYPAAAEMLADTVPVTE